MLLLRYKAGLGWCLAWGLGMLGGDRGLLAFGESIRGKAYLSMKDNRLTKH
jgi:hypothetical protein